MRMYKLLFFFLALFSLNSCVEYIDNGVKPEEGQTPEEKKFVAALKETTAKYVGDKFEFEAKLNGIDVTSTTKFTVNGTDIKGSHYVPFKEGSHSVVATIDNLTANFKFTVLPIEEEPEPEGNRIEYDGNSYPVTTTVWIVNGDPSENAAYIEEVDVNGTKVKCTKWLLVNTDNANPSNAKALYYNLIYVAVKADGSIAFPDESQIYHIKGLVRINTDNFQMQDVSYAFNTMTDTNADYTSETNLDNSKKAKLFWNGPYQIGIDDLSQISKGVNSLKNLNVAKANIKNLKTSK